MKRIDSHVHFWNYDPVRNSWITEEMAVLKRNFLPGDLQPLLEARGIDGCMLVQVNQAETENDFFLQLASANAFVSGVVGWVDLCRPDLDARLEYYRKFDKIRGFRHILQDEEDRAFMLRPDFKKGVGQLGKWGFTYDLLVHPDQLPFTVSLLASLPGQPFVIDHLAKPEIRKKEMDVWKKGITAVSRMENVYCKLSGMVTEADGKNWTKETFRPYMDVIVESFGTRRILFGSDWPVCLLAASYAEVLDIADDYFSSFSASEKEGIFGDNAASFYGL